MSYPFIAARHPLPEAQQAVDWGMTILGATGTSSLHRSADAEEAKASGGMVALFPRSDYAEMLAVAGGEPMEDLHVTLVFLGTDVSDQPDGGLGSSVDQIAGSFSEITASVFGHAVFNPDSPDPAGVYLINGNGSGDLAQLQQEVLQAAQMSFPIPEQHTPWIPHITVAYGNPPQIGQYTGDIVFDRIGFAFAGQTQFYPLLGADNSMDSPTLAGLMPRRRHGAGYQGVLNHRGYPPI